MALRMTCLAMPALLFFSTIAVGQDDFPVGEAPAAAGGSFAEGGKLRGDLSDLLDADADGDVSDTEAQKAAMEFAKEANARTKSERGQRILDALDADKDGKLNDEEAMMGVAEARGNAGGAGGQIADMFLTLDADGNKTLTRDEFAAGIEQLGPLAALLKPQMAGIFTKFDSNRDGSISFVEAQMGADAFANNMGIPREQRGGGEAPDPKLVAMAQQTIGRLDRNRDKMINKAEAKRDKIVEQEFVLVDTNLDDQLNTEEIYNYLKAQQPPEEKREERPWWMRGRDRGGDRGGDRGRFGPPGGGDRGRFGPPGGRD